MTTVPKISIQIDETDIQNGARQILSVIRPNWSQLEFKILTDGITNKLVACKERDGDASETVLVRVYGNKTDLLIDRKAETRNIRMLSALDLAPNLYATFENGLAYRFVPGTTLNDETVKHRSVYPLIAKQMGKLHKVRYDGEIREATIWSKINAFLDIVPDVFTDSGKQQRFASVGKISKSELRQEIDYLKRHLSDLGSPIVFCHNDLLLGNVIYTEEKSCVTFIDYEYAAFNYQAFDIANHFLEFAGLDNVDYNNYPSKELQYDWYRCYLKEFQGDYTECDVDSLFELVNQFTALSHLFWGIWALIQTEHSYIDFDFLGYGFIRLEQYFIKKHTFC